MSHYVNRLTPSEYLRRYLAVAPLALALFRSIEAKYISTISMRRPILDLGCGFGEFAGVFFDSQVEAGLDISWKEIIEAKKSNRYKNLTCVDAIKMPYPDKSFATVVSISVLEHITNTIGVVKEVFRILKPNGQFILTVNSSKIDSLLFWPKVFRYVGLDYFADVYIRLYHNIFRHKTLLNKTQWEKILIGSGFTISSSSEIISPQATRFFDIMLATSWPSQILKIITGRRYAWRPRWFREWLIRKFTWLVALETRGGSNIFIVAIKSK